MNVATFTAGDGTRYGLVSLEGSSAVVVFKHDGEAFRGRLEFNDQDSTGISPGEALPHIAQALENA